MADLCFRVRCLVPNLCSHAVGRVLLMAERCKLDRLRCVFMEGGRKGSSQRPVDLSSRKGTKISGSSPACAPNMTVCPAS